MQVKCINHSSVKAKILIRKEFARIIMEKVELSKEAITELGNNKDITFGIFYSYYKRIDNGTKYLQDEALELFNNDINLLLAVVMM